MFQVRDEVLRNSVSGSYKDSHFGTDTGGRQGSGQDQGRIRVHGGKSGVKIPSSRDLWGRDGYSDGRRYGSEGLSESTVTTSDWLFQPWGRWGRNVPIPGVCIGDGASFEPLGYSTVETEIEDEKDVLTRREPDLLNP